MPKEEHGMHHKADGRCEGRVGESKGERKEVKVKQRKQQKEDAGKEVDPV
jgi:hypothetical protein